MNQGIGRARLAIPRVNQNPQPRIGRTQPVLRQQSGVAPAKPVARIGVSPAKPLTTAQPSNTVQPATAAPPTQPVDPFQTAAQAPTAYGSHFQIPAYTPQAGQPDPRDATYWTNVSKLRFEDEQKYGENLREQSMADSAYSDALQTAIRNRALQERTLGEEAIKGNLGASGWLDRNEGLQRAAYTQERSQASLTKSQEDQARLAAREALEQGFGIDAAGELAAAAGRYAAGSAGASKEEEPEAAPSTSSAKSGKSGGKSGGKGRSGGGGNNQKGTGGSARGNGGTTAPPPKPNPTKAALGKARKAR